MFGLVGAWTIGQVLGPLGLCFTLALGLVPSSYHNSTLRRVDKHDVIIMRNTWTFAKKL